MKHFEKEGNIYKMKPQYVFNTILLTMIFLFVVLGFYIKVPAMMWISLAFFVIIAFTLWTKKLIIDTDRKEITGKIALIKPAFTIPFDDIVNFELLITSHNFVKTNSALTVYYMKNGKEKSAMIAQGITTKAMQNILNDIEDIIGDAKTER